MLRPNRQWTGIFFPLVFSLLFILQAALAQEPSPNDQTIQREITAIYDEIDGLESIGVNVAAGVVQLSGEVVSAEAITQAETIALEVTGVVAVENNLTRSLAVEDAISPAWQRLRDQADRLVGGFPLFLVSLGVFLALAFAVHLFANWTWLWRRLVPNAFLGDLIATGVRVAGIILALIFTLSLVGANAAIGTILGGAGVLGIAIGFGVRDTLENFISSIMLSLRQPFRAMDHVIIDGQEGKVIRLTSRATVLMTLDGNHLRIPNSVVFKSNILNYSRNPERRFSFELGVDAADDPVEAMAMGVEALEALDFLLTDPKPFAIIKTVGDSNIVLTFFAWVDQRTTDFGKSRSEAIRTTKNVLEDNGFTLPEPIYRLRIEDMPIPASNSNKRADAQDSDPERAELLVERPKRAEPHTDVTPDDHLDEKVKEERALSTETDLLDDEKPTE